MDSKLSDLFSVKACINALILSPLLLVVAGCASTAQQPDDYAIAKQNFAKQNYYTAYQKLLVPAEKGNPDAEYALGYLYYYGHGTEKNTALGKQWILKAAQDGNKEAKEAYRRIIEAEQGMYTDPDVTQQNTVTKKPKPIHQKGYTLQLAALHSHAQANSFVNYYSLKSQAKISQVTRNGKTFYVVTYGSYANQKQAQQALKQLPYRIRSLKPWVTANH